MDGKKLKSEAVLCLISPLLKGEILSSSKRTEIIEFFEVNEFSSQQTTFIESIFHEARLNKFIIKIQSSK